VFFVYDPSSPLWVKVLVAVAVVIATVVVIAMSVRALRGTRDDD
jgi:hypothetical protein